MGLNDSGDAVKYIGGVFEGAFSASGRGPERVDPGLVVASSLGEPDAVVAVDLPHNPPATRSGGPSPLGTITDTASLGKAYCQCRLKLPMAVATRRIAVDGNVASKFDLAALGAKLYAGYVERLNGDVHEDLNV